MDDKTDLRIRFKNLRKTFELGLLSELLTEKIRSTEVYQRACNVMIFYPTKYEIDVRGLLEDAGKTFYLPRVNGAELQVCPYCKDDLLEKSAYNIMEPCNKPVDAKVLDLIIVPALAVDKKNYRLGYGGGFYDRFLAKNLSAKTMVPVSEKQVIEALPVEDFDRPVDFVITV